MATSAAWLAAAFGPSRRQRLGDRRLGRRLEAPVERCHHGQILIADAAEIGQLLDDPIGEIAAVGVARRDSARWTLSCAAAAAAPA